MQAMTFVMLEQIHENMVLPVCAIGLFYQLEQRDIGAVLSKCLLNIINKVPVTNND